MLAAFHIETAEPDYNLKAHVIPMGDDLLVAIYGGDRPHIGAVSMSEKRSGLEAGSPDRTRPSTFSYPSHKEDVLTEEASTTLASALGTNAVVVAGVHFHRIDRHGIERVIENCRLLTGLIIARLQDGTTEVKR